MKTIIKKYEEIHKMKFQAEKLQEMDLECDAIVELAFLEVSKKEEEFEKLQDIVINAVWDNLKSYNLGRFFSKNIEGEKNHENIKKLVEDGKKNDYDYDYEKIAKPFLLFLEEEEILDKIIEEIKNYEEKDE